jgi:hypothetical protein
LIEAELGGVLMRTVHGILLKGPSYYFGVARIFRVAATMRADCIAWAHILILHNPAKGLGSPTKQHMF